MLLYIYDWIKNIAFYMILTTAVIQIVPNHSYQKYLRFFTGLLLILLLITPVIKIAGQVNLIQNFFQSREYEKQMQTIEKETGKFEQQLEEQGYAE